MDVALGNAGRPHTILGTDSINTFKTQAVRQIKEDRRL